MSLRPWYNKDANYQTNAKSFMDYLARTNKFLELLIEDYEIFQELVIEELKRIKFNAEMEVKDILLNWLEDGTLYRIINDEVFGNKADKDWVNEQLTQISEDIQKDLKETTDEVERKLQETRTNVENQLKVNNDLVNGNIEQVNLLKTKVPSNHHNSESSSTLQEAIYAGENGVVHIKKGTYLIDTPIRIKSNTKIIAYGSTFKRNANINNLFINDSNGSQGGYSANENIEIIGAVFDGAGGAFSDKCSLLVFGHSKNIKIVDCTFKNLRDWHMIELNACQNVLVEHCLFENYGTSTMGTEMVQIDVAKSTTEFPWFGPYDNTTCDNIRIQHSTFMNGVRGIGTHTSVDGKEHTRITIIENEFQNMTGESIYGLDWAFTKIHDNHFNLVFMGVHLRVQGRQVNNHSIIGNYMAGLPNNTESRGIHIEGLSGGHGIQGGTIKNNKIKRFGSHGIGVDYSGKWVIDGNECQNNGKNGIILWGASLVTVTGNVSLDNNESNSNQFDIGVREPGSEHITMTGNTIGRLRVFNDTRHIFATGNTIMNEADFVHSDTRVLKNNFINGVYTE